MSVGPVGRSHVKPWSEEAITDEDFRAKFIKLPGIIQEWVREHLVLEGSDVMDFGCGEGITALALALKLKARQVVGIDIMPDIERCLPKAQAQLGLERLPENLTLYRVEPGHLHDHHDRFDLIYSWSTFEHVDQRIFGDVLLRLRGTLKPGGLLFVQIAPLYYSSEGSHLFHKISERWGHLLDQESVFYDKLAAAVPDEEELRALWSTYRTLNRLDAGELVDALRNYGFEILRTYTTQEDYELPEKLRSVFQEEALRTNQIVALARPIRESASKRCSEVWREPVR